MEYLVHERFQTFQGEGVHLGRRAFFIRLYGCPVKCPWCDSAGTWHPKWKPSGIPRMTEVELGREFERSKAEIVVITGGEPAIYDLEPLIQYLREKCSPVPQVHLETSGGFKIKGQPGWITLSPKRWKPPLVENIRNAHEYKIIVEAEEDLKYYHQVLEDGGFYLNPNRPPVWLHPEWSHREDPKVLTAISKWVAKYGDPYRAGWQVHKLYKVDSLDPRVQPLVPLGGDPKKGY